MEREIIHAPYGSGRIARRWPSTVLLSTALGAVLLVLPVASGGTFPPIWTSASTGWTNGAVTCDFQPDRPGANVSAAGAVDAGIYVGIGQLVELAPNGSAVAMASMSGAAWTIVNQSWDHTLGLAYEANVSEFGAIVPAKRVGLVDVQVVFALPAYDENPTPNATVVTIEAQFSNWSWQASVDTLSLRLVTWPVFSDSEHLELGLGSGVTSVSNRTGQEQEYLTPAASASVTTGPGAARSIPAVPVPSLSADRGSVHVNFSTGAGEYQNLRYSAVVGIALHSAILGIPLYEYAMTGAAAALASIVVAWEVRSARRHPSDLIFAAEGPQEPLHPSDSPGVHR